MGFHDSEMLGEYVVAKTLVYCQSCKEDLNQDYVKKVYDFGLDRGRPRAQCKDCRGKWQVATAQAELATALCTGLLSACRLSWEAGESLTSVRSKASDKLRLLKQCKALRDGTQHLYKTSCDCCRTSLSLDCYLIVTSEEKLAGCPKVLCHNCYQLQKGRWTNSSAEIQHCRVVDLSDIHVLEKFVNGTSPMPQPPTLQEVRPSINVIGVPREFSQGVSIRDIVDEIALPAIQRGVEEAMAGQTMQSHQYKKQRVSNSDLTDPEQRLQSVTSLIATGNYLQFNFEAIPGSRRETPLLRVFDALDTWMPKPNTSASRIVLREAIAAHVDGESILLCLIGASKHSTGWHRDSTEAVNVALRLADVNANGRARKNSIPVGEVSVQPLARWLFIQPGKEEEVARYQMDQWQLPFTKDIALSDEQMFALAEHFSAPSQNPVVSLINQQHGGVVIVPPGTVHCVRNLNSCCKIAREVFNPANFCLYFEALQHGGCRYFGNDNAEDYMRAGGIMLSAIQKIVGYKCGRAKA